MSLQFDPSQNSKVSQNAALNDERCLSTCRKENLCEKGSEQQNRDNWLNQNQSKSHREPRSEPEANHLRNKMKEIQTRFQKELEFG